VGEVGVLRIGDCWSQTAVSKLRYSLLHYFFFLMSIGVKAKCLPSVFLLLKNLIMLEINRTFVWCELLHLHTHTHTHTHTYIYLYLSSVVLRLAWSHTVLLDLSVRNSHNRDHTVLLKWTEFCSRLDLQKPAAGQWSEVCVCVCVNNAWD